MLERFLVAQQLSHFAIEASIVVPRDQGPQEFLHARNDFVLTHSGHRERGGKERIGRPFFLRTFQLHLSGFDRGGQLLGNRRQWAGAEPGQLSRNLLHPSRNVRAFEAVVPHVVQQGLNLSRQAVLTVGEYTIDLPLAQGCGLKMIHVELRQRAGLRQPHAQRGHLGPAFLLHF